MGRREGFVLTTRRPLQLMLDLSPAMATQGPEAAAPRPAPSRHRSFSPGPGFSQPRLRLSWLTAEMDLKSLCRSTADIGHSSCHYLLNKGPYPGSAVGLRFCRRTCWKQLPRQHVWEPQEAPPRHSGRPCSLRSGVWSRPAWSDSWLCPCQPRDLGHVPVLLRLGFPLIK